MSQQKPEAKSQNEHHKKVNTGPGSFDQTTSDQASLDNCPQTNPGTSPKTDARPDSPTPEVILITGTEQTRLSLTAQLQDYLPPGVQVTSFAIDEGLPSQFPEGLLVFSSKIAYQEVRQFKNLNIPEIPGEDTIIARRAIDFDALEELFFLPEGSRVFFVNDVRETACNGIAALKEIGVDHLELFPYYPDMPEEEIAEASLAITPGEVDKVPEGVQEIINIGPRLLDYTTIIKILNHLQVLEHQAGQFSRRYLEKIIALGKKLAGSARQINNLNEHLNQIIHGLKEAVLVYDLEGRISVATGQVRELLDLGNKNLSGRCLQDVIYRKDLLAYLMDKQQEDKELFTLNDSSLAVRKLYLENSNYIITIFENVEETLASNRRLKQELINRGYYARYSFSDIIGSSSRIREVKDIAERLARTELTILLEGETGTGKELFAGAVHNASPRKEGPFLAVNFSSLHDDLIESELFGYEEGAFTGAKKGGKAGLFEQAEGGTIFLDEIGDTSPRVQARLLRVLQEKEIMRVGSTEIKPVDVRIIAATNKNISALVQSGRFRRDLYYRLKTGYIKVPPLRERKEDLEELINYFVSIKSASSIEVAPGVLAELQKYDWYGNVRELKNTINYMLAVTENSRLTLADIPDPGFFQRQNPAYYWNITREEADQQIPGRGNYADPGTEKSSGPFKDSDNNESHLNKSHINDSYYSDHYNHTSRYNNSFYTDPHYKSPENNDLNFNPPSHNDSNDFHNDTYIDSSPGREKSPKPPDASPPPDAGFSADLFPDLSEEEYFLLQQIYQCLSRGEQVGRKSLASRLEGCRLSLTEHQLRSRLSRLEEKGYLKRYRGRRGTVLTDRGRKAVRSSSQGNA